MMCVHVERTELRLTHHQSPSLHNAVLRVTTIERSHCNWFSASVPTSLWVPHYRGHEVGRSTIAQSGMSFIVRYQ